MTIDRRRRVLLECTAFEFGRSISYMHSLPRCLVVYGASILANGGLEQAFGHFLPFFFPVARHPICSCIPSARCSRRMAVRWYLTQRSQRPFAPKPVSRDTQATHPSSFEAASVPPRTTPTRKYICIFLRKLSCPAPPCPSRRSPSDWPPSDFNTLRGTPPTFQS